jgi:hypothetical protein
VDNRGVESWFYVWEIKELIFFKQKKNTKIQNKLNI